MAETILKAATDEGRDCNVEAMPKMNMFISKPLPELADRMSVEHADRQQESSRGGSADRF